jgi:MarR family transcriptional regulator, temperature-dependent positive regulator of motility
MYFNTSALARRLEREWTEAFAPFGLTPPQAFMLRAILERPGMVQSQLAEEMSIARPTATRALDGLERLGLIERQASESDGRETAVQPTKRGAALRTGLNEASAAVTKRLKRLLGEDVFSSMVSTVKGIRSALG